MNIYNLFYKAPAPEGIEERNAHIIGGGMAGLAAAVFLIDDAGMPGKNITLYEKRNSLGGCCDAYSGEAGYICPGERELEPFMECLWYLCSKIPSLEDPSISVLDESVRANKDMPIHSESRLLCKQGHIYEKVHDYRMSPELLLKMEHFTSIPEKDLEDMTIEDYFGKDSEFFHSSLWWCYHSMLAFKPYHSALEAQRYFNRFGLLNRLDYLEGILHTKRNDKDSVIKPIHKWLEDQGVTFRMDTAVYDLEMDEAFNTVYGIKIKNQETIPVRAQDYVLLTSGSMMTNASYGDNTHIAEINRDTEDMGLFTVWKNLAARNKKFGNPDKFLSHIDKTKWMSFFLTVEDYPEFFERLEKMTGSKSGTGGGITFMDSGWEMSLVIYDRDYFPDQREKNRDVLWGDGLFGERIGSYIKKPMAECTGNEIIEEMLYHFGMLDMKDEVLAHSHISTCMMPYITSQFMPRKESDRPTIIPKDCTNLALIGQYVEVPRDVVFTIETSVRTPLEAVYMLTGLDKEIIEVNPARYDLRYIKERVMKFGGMKGKITEEDLPKINPLKLWLGKAKLIKELLKKANEIPPYYIMYPGRDKSITPERPHRPILALPLMTGTILNMEEITLPTPWASTPPLVSWLVGRLFFASMEAVVWSPISSTRAMKHRMEMEMIGPSSNLMPKCRGWGIRIHASSPMGERSSLPKAAAAALITRMAMRGEALERKFLLQKWLSRTMIMMVPAASSRLMGSP